MSRNGRDLPLVKSAIRALEVLELFSREQRPLTLSQIIEALGYPQSSTSVMLKNLLIIGYVNYNRDDRTYFPNVTVTKLGDWIGASAVIRGPIRRLMEDMRRRTKESISIAVQNDINVHFLDVVNSEHKVKFFVPQRGQRTLLQSNLGWTLLAPKHDKDIASIHKQIGLLGTHRMPTLRETMAKISDIRRDGYCFIPNLPVPGAASVATLLPTTFHGQRMAIGVGGYVPRLEANLPGIVDAMEASLAEFEIYGPPDGGDLVDASTAVSPEDRAGPPSSVRRHLGRPLTFAGSRA
jgi:DNA-binding IclR family transcriptional regulator